MEKRAKIVAERTQEEWRALALQHIPIDDPRVLEWVAKHYPEDKLDMDEEQAALAEAKEKLRVFLDTHKDKIFNLNDLPSYPELSRLQHIHSDVVFGEQYAEESEVNRLHVYSNIQNESGEDVEKGIESVNRIALSNAMRNAMERELMPVQTQIFAILDMEIKMLKDIRKMAEVEMKKQDPAVMNEHAELQKKVEMARKRIESLKYRIEKRRKEAAYYIRLGIPKISFEISPIAVRMKTTE